MQIYLVRHGDYIMNDPEQRLSSEGEEQIRRVGKALKDLGVSFQAVITSPKMRAKQTGLIIAELTRFPAEKIIETTTVKPSTPPKEALEFLRDYEDYKSILIAGHLPSLDEISSCLLMEKRGGCIRFEPGTICSIECAGPAPGTGEIRWVMPQRIIKTLIHGA